MFSFFFSDFYACGLTKTAAVFLSRKNQTSQSVLFYYMTLPKKFNIFAR